MWTYSQSTGEISHNGQPVGAGYSGIGTAKNNPEDQDWQGRGPIPRGLWEIGAAVDLPNLGPVVMPLTPADRFNRGGFFIHGDSAEHPGAASHGCIVLARPIRELIAASVMRGDSADKVLVVVA
jgi:hypothetical protein